MSSFKIVSLILLLCCFASLIYARDNMKITKITSEYFTAGGDSILLQKLKNLDKKKFVKKSVGTFLKDPLIAKYSSHLFSDEPPGRLQYMTIIFTKNLYIQVYVSDYKYVERFNINRNWNFEKFKKEKVRELRLYYHDKLVEQVD